MSIITFTGVELSCMSGNYYIAGATLEGLGFAPDDIRDSAWTGAAGYDHIFAGRLGDCRDQSAIEVTGYMVAANDSNESMRHGELPGEYYGPVFGTLAEAETWIKNNLEEGE